MSNGETDFRLTISCWDLCELSEHDLNTWDIAALNLAAAQGLPGLDAVNVGACFDKLDDWAQRVKVEMLRHMYRFDPQSNQPKTEFWIPPDRFNVEGAGEGIAFYPDSHYIQWPHLWKESDFEHK